MKFFTPIKIVLYITVPIIIALSLTLGIRIKQINDSNNLNNQFLESDISDELYKIVGVASVFFGPGFITITKNENVDWALINQDIISIFDKL